MRAIKCPFCELRYVKASGLENHIKTQHTDMAPKNIPIQQMIFNINNRYPPFKETGTSVIFKLPTKWNPESGKYDRFSSEKEIEAYKEQFRQRMMKTYGKINLLNDPEFQRKMLKGRKISGEFTMFDGTKKEYTGTYEKDFLYFLNILRWPTEDIVVPAPVNIRYLGPDGKYHFYIPDFYFPSIDLIVEIKSSENNHYRARDIETEKAKDIAIEKTNHKYIKVYDKKYDDFVNLVHSFRDDFEMMVG